MGLLKAIFLTLTILLTMRLATIQPLSSQNLLSPQATITISGTVTGPGNSPVAGAHVSAWLSTGQEAHTTTDAAGKYVLNLPPGMVAMHIGPPLAARLAEKYRDLGQQNSSFTQDFALAAGHLLSGSVRLPGGSPPEADLWVNFVPVSFALPDDEWLGAAVAPGDGKFQAVAPAGVYWIEASLYPDLSAHEPVDLGAGDITGIVLKLSNEPADLVPYDPPVAAKIKISAVDNLGEAVVTGTPGAALPLSNVLLVNLNSTHQAHAISGVDGSFTARIYAPPGSAIMVKHGPPGWRWNDIAVGVSEMLSPIPGTILNVGFAHNSAQDGLPFAAAGAINYWADDPRTTRNFVGSAWAIEGALTPVVSDGQWTRIYDGLYEGKKTPGLYLGGLNWTHPALVDLDDDGDLDLLLGERSGHLILYRNVGSKNSPDWQFETADFAGIASGEWAYPALADVNGDGAPDLFVGTGNGLVRVYYNRGAPASPVWPAGPDVTLTTGNMAAPALADLDNDGDLDLLVGKGDNTLTHFRNSGTLTNPAWTLASEKYANISEAGEGLQPSFVDLDGDQDLDLLIGRCGDLVWYRNNGPPANPTWSRVAEGYAGLGFSCAVSPALGDWDGDGDADLVTGEHWGRPRFFRNDGPPNWAAVDISFPFDLDGDSAPALADWDDDGDLDMLVGQAHGNVYKYTNAGSAGSADWQYGGIQLTLPWTDHPHAFPALVDIDNDNAPDLFIGEGGWQGPAAGGNIHYYHNDGSASAPDWQLVTTSFESIDVGGWSKPAFADINGDSDMDLFIGAEDGTLTFVENVGTPTAPAWAAPVHPYAGLALGAYSAPAFFDVDQDGDLDMLAGLGDGSLTYVRNNGTINTPDWEVVAEQYPNMEAGGNAMPTAADIDGDGKPDLVIGNGDGGLALYHYDGPGSPPVQNDTYAPGDLFRVSGKVRLYSPAISASSDVSAISGQGWLNMMMIANAAGDSIAAKNAFMSTLLTPSGFPIQRSGRSGEWLDSDFSISNLRHLGGHAIEGELAVTARLPQDLPAGTYRPSIELDFSGVPSNTEWLAANVTFYNFSAREAALPPIKVGEVKPPHLYWRLLMNDFVQGTRGTGANEDRGKFEVSSQIVTQGAPYYIPPVDEQTGQPIPYRLEPFLPTISFSDRRMPSPPLIPFDLPGGRLCVSIRKPDGNTRNLGCEVLAQSFNRTKTTRSGNDLNVGTVQLDDVYALKAASDRFRVTFDQYGRHTITMTGHVKDLWGNSYTGGGTYEVWIAHPLDIDPGVLPGTPLAAGDSFNPAIQFYPRVPADVKLTITHYPGSDPQQVETISVSGKANPFGYFNTDETPITFTKPGEYRADITATYRDAGGKLYMGTMTWGGIVMTPPAEANLIAHGRRGLDNLDYIPNHWFVASRDLNIPQNTVAHALNPYYNGDILWSRMADEKEGGNALVMGASVQDLAGVIEPAIKARFDRVGPELYAPGSGSERFNKNEIPLFSSTYSGRPAQMVPGDRDQIAYSYRTSQRPGVRVREIVAEDGESGGYWRLDTLYDDQLGVGIQGDLPNDFKFQYVGVVYRDLASGYNEYVGQGSGWVFIPDDDPLGNRVMPPFAGPGNGGWTTEGGPIVTLKGKDVHIFILPTGVRPGAILEVGDTFHFAGHIMPTLDSQVEVKVTAPSGSLHTVNGRANAVGYFYKTAGDFVVDEAGLWSVDVRVWHDGLCSGGKTVPPYPSGDVLGSQNGRYYFYVVPAGSARLNLSSPSPGFLTFNNQVSPIPISGSVPAGLSDVTIDYTISMPGTILQQGRVTPKQGLYQILFDPAALSQTFPNLDLVARDGPRPGLSDSFSIGLLLRGKSGANPVYRANTITIQGEQVYTGSDSSASRQVNLPVVLAK